ncbi:hypothetical protein [Desmospora activa]|uniref:DUF2019 domain-containing protein n=1 Tax=Desmospora activa DSM 45169 TaxID=1121389 RepID=A0A2T4ZB96_9BACL|nr:hypothetical protein [Desmospora activa]PTM59162.1 hypothetical protein C8J48_1764 [Desmospora activa DSM 45169]
MVFRRSVEMYIDACQQQGQAWEKGDYQSANECNKLKVMHLHKLKRSEKGIKALVSLMDHDDPYVKLSAAVHSLPYEETRALKNLQYLQGITGILGFHAETALKEWKKGNLKV